MGINSDKKAEDIPEGDHAPGAYPIDDARPVGYMGRPSPPRNQHHHQAAAAAAGDEEDQRQQHENSHIPPEMRMPQPATNHDETAAAAAAEQQVDSSIPPEMRIQEQHHDEDEDAGSPVDVAGIEQNATSTTEAEEEDVFDPSFRRIPVDASVRLATSSQKNNKSSSEKELTTTSNQRVCSLMILSACLLLVTGLVITLAVVLPSSSSQEDPEQVNLNDDKNDGSLVPPPTSPPITSSSEQDDDELYDTLLGLFHQVSGDIIMDESSPQYQTLEWMVHEDWRTGLDELLENESGTIHLVERYVVALLYFSTNGAAWTKRSGFLSAFPICRWGEKETDMEMNTTRMEQDDFSMYKHHVHIVCNGDGEEAGLVPPTVKELRIVDNNLQGSIPTEISLLSDLETLELLKADLVGEVPDLIPLQKLQHLTLSGIGLTGTIPTSLTSLNAEFMHVLNLEHNQLVGDIPDEMGTLSNLMELRLAYNALDGTIPETLAELDQLSIASFEGNNFTGSMDSVLSCSLKDPFLRLSADCIEVTCSCCTICCHQSTNNNATNLGTGTVADIVC